MKTYPLIYLLVAGMAVIGLGASAAEPDIAVAWEKAPYILKDPARKLYVAASQPLGYADSHHQYGYYHVWGKLIHEEPNRHGRHNVAEEWVEMRLDCATMRYTLSRYVMLDGVGTRILDATLTDSSKRIRTEWDDPDHMKFTQLTADIAGRELCAVPP